MSLADEQDSVRFSISGNSLDQTHSSWETTEKSSQKSSQRSSQRILELVAADDKITTQEMADKLDISRRAVAKAIAKLRSAGILRRVGPDKGGCWEIISTDSPPTDER
jgi:ATP-dependent DNA helicase RecG